MCAGPWWIESSARFDAEVVMGKYCYKELSIPSYLNATPASSSTVWQSGEFKVGYSNSSTKSESASTILIPSLSVWLLNVQTGLFFSSIAHF